MVLAVIAQVFCSTRLFADKQNGLPKELAATSAPTTPEPLPRRCGGGPGLRVPEATRSAAARSASAKNAAATAEPLLLLMRQARELLTSSNIAFCWPLSMDGEKLASFHFVRRNFD